MTGQPDQTKRPRLHSLWITLEAVDVIELKRIGMDRDELGAATFFREVLMPRLRVAARQRGMALDLLGEATDNDGLISG